MRLLLISPHLDDAVFSAGQLLAANPGSIVVTVFAGVPEDRKLLTPYDEKMGFRTSHIAMKVRRNEDGRALQILQCHPVHLDNLDSQYQDSDRKIDLDPILAEAKRCEAIVGPVGINHPDHLLVATMMSELAAITGKPTYLWADLPYRREYPDELKKVAGKLKKGAPAWLGSKSKKLRACMQYSSQWGKYAIVLEDVIVEELFWRLP